MPEPILVAFWWKNKEEPKDEDSWNEESQQVNGEYGTQYISDREQMIMLKIRLLILYQLIKFSSWVLYRRIIIIDYF